MTSSICFTRSDFGCPITPRHFLPKVATAITPVLGIFLGLLSVKTEAKNLRKTLQRDDLPKVVESFDHRNHYKIAILTNCLLSLAAAITTVALGILSPFLGIPLAIAFGGLATVVALGLKQSISYVKDCQQAFIEGNSEI